MGTRKKGSELVFNLQWRNMPDNGGDRSNVVGMYDTPTTTLNFETFKSYLLKNSGVLVNDVKVTYLTDNGAEWVIDSQEWFEIALCAFRLKARLGEVIFLKLDKISNHHMIRKHSNDAETQFDNDTANQQFDTPPEWFLKYMKQFKRDVVEEVTYAVSSNAAANPTEKEVPAPPAVLPPKKIKSDSSKRSRKHMLLGETPIDKELLKTFKFDRKLEIKLDKLDAKTKKIKEKKQALISKIEQCDDEVIITKFPARLDTRPFMNACILNEPIIVPRMIGGETYLHTWEVTNSGGLAWTSLTDLRLTWGSAEMKPLATTVRCPALQPGERTKISVKFLIPEKIGQYESYWNFYDRNIRFGSWVSFCVIVDGPGAFPYVKKPKIEQSKSEKKASCLKSQEKKSNSSKQRTSQENFVMVQDNSADSDVEGAVGGSGSVMDLSKRMKKVKIAPSSQADSDSDWESLWSYGVPRKPKNTDDDNNIATDGESRKSNKYGINEKDLIVDLSTTKENKSPSPIQSPIATNDIVPKLEQETVTVTEENRETHDDNNNNGEAANNISSGESICEVGSDASDISSGFDVVSVPVCEEKEDSGYVYITVDGNKLPVPKHILRPDFLVDAEEAPGPVNPEDDEKATLIKHEDIENLAEDAAASAVKLESQIQKLEQDIQDTKSFMSHCSAAGTCYSDVTSITTSANNRLFIFPQNNPGYEVVHPNSVSIEETSKAPNMTAENQPAQTIPTNYTISPVMMTSPSYIDFHKVKSPPIMTAPNYVDFYKVKSPPITTSPNYIDVPEVKNPDFSKIAAEVKPNQEFFSNLYPGPVYPEAAKAADASKKCTVQYNGKQYTWGDMPNTSCGYMPAAQLRYGPYGPMDQSTPRSPKGGNSPPLYHTFPPVANFQQSNPRRCSMPAHKPKTPTAPPPPPPQRSPTQRSPTSSVQSAHILPENLVSGAVNVASSAINTARSVINMIVPPKSDPGKWVNGHWVSENAESTRTKNLDLLAEMGFWDRDLNATLLARYNDDVTRVVSELVQ